jgi:hypothetical protein
MSDVAIELDRKQPLVLVVRFHRTPSDEEFAAYLAEYTRILESEPRFGAVFVTTPNAPMTPPRQVRRQADFMKEYRQQIEQRVVGIAFALPSPLMRGVLRGIFMLQPMPCPHIVVGTEAEGVAWLKARLWTDHVRRMKGAAP